jgi:hypothetical protein
MVQIFEELIVGLISGIVASFAFFIMLRLWLPRLSISAEIAKEQLGGKQHFTFKIVNKSRRALINVHVQAQLAELKGAEGGQLFVTHAIPIKRDRVFHVGGFSRRDIRADYAIRFATEQDIEAMWVDESALVRFRVIATDEISGLSRAFLKEFHTKRHCIKSGSHGFGSSLSVT